MENSDRFSTEIWNDVTVLCTLYDFSPNPKLAPLLGKQCLLSQGFMNPWLIGRFCHSECIHLVSASSDHIRDLPVYTSFQILIATSSGIHGPIIGKRVIITSLVASHKYSILHEWQTTRTWDDSSSDKARFASVSDNVGKRLNILKYGSIGRQVARSAKVMGFDVLAFTANPCHTAESRRDHEHIVFRTEDPEGEIPSARFSGLEKGSLHRFLDQDLDQLLISVPLTQQTKQLLGREEFRILSKRNALITNIARGEVIIQEDLIEALKEFEMSSSATDEVRNGLRGAAIDVATSESVPKDHLL